VILPARRAGKQTLENEIQSHFSHHITAPICASH
jgi:hypothetical protein